MTEEMMKEVMKEVKNVDIQLSMPRITYHEAMNRFGSDKRDTRFAMELIHVSEVVKDSEFKVFESAVKNGGKVALLNVKGQAKNFSRKDIDKLTEYVKVYDAKGLAWLKLEGAEVKGPIAKFLSDEEKQAIINLANGEDGDLFLFVADKASVVYDSL